MYNIAAPIVDNIKEYDRVIATRSSKNAEYLRALRSTIRASYASYAASAPRVESIVPARLATSSRNLLRSNFTRLDSGKPCSDIRQEIFSRTTNALCPYCRLADATTLDHILEKNAFPEFSILRVNLAPVCDSCNRKKESNRRESEGRARLHLYFDGFPTEPHIRMTPEIHGEIVTFRFWLTRPSSVEATWWEAVETHFETLGLALRYATRAQMEMNDRAEILQNLRRRGGPDEVSRHLRVDSGSRAKYWGRQDWVCALLDGASQDADFCDKGVFLLG